MTTTEAPKRTRAQVLADSRKPLDHDLVCEFCHEFTVPAGTPSAKTRMAAHKGGCKSNPNRTPTIDELMETWPDRVAKGELIPFTEMTTYEKEREKYVAIVRALAENGGSADSPTGGATAVLVEMLPFDVSGPTLTMNFTAKLIAGGWLERNVNGKRTYSYSLTKAAKVYYPPKAPQAAPVAPEPEVVTPEPEPVIEETVHETARVPDEDEVVRVEPTNPPSVGDDEDEDVPGRPGRFAARVLREIPEIVELAVRREIQRDRDSNYAAQGYYPTIPQEQVDALREQVHSHDSIVAQLQTQIADLRQQLTLMEYAFDEVDAQQDAALARSNDGTPNMKGSLSAEKVNDPLKGLARVALKAGWTIKHTRGGHLAWRSPEGKTVFSASTGHSNSVNIMRRKLRRAGLEIEGRTQEAADVDKFAGWNQ